MHSSSSFTRYCGKPLLERKLEELLQLDEEDKRRFRNVLRTLDHLSLQKREQPTEKLQEELRTHGPPAGAFLRKQLHRTEHPEIRNRLRSILRQQDATSPCEPGSSSLGVLRGLRVLLFVDTHRSKHVLRRIASAVPDTTIGQRSRTMLRALGAGPVSARTNTERR